MKYGSMRHSPSGRKKKTNYWGKSKSYTREFKDYQPTRNFRLEEPKHPSLPVQMTSTETQDNRQERLAISSQYTIAPAYNKGAYQVIAKENVKHIGR